MSMPYHHKSLYFFLKIRVTQISPPIMSSQKMYRFLQFFTLVLISALGTLAQIPPIPPYWFFTSYCSDTPVLNYWEDTYALNGEWSLVRFSSPYTSNTLPLPNCGKIVISGDANETKTWTTTIEKDGELVTSVKETKVTSLQLSGGRWLIPDYGVFTHDHYSMKPISSLLLLGYTRTVVEHYDSILFASCTYIHVPMGNPLNRISEFGILVRKGTEDLYDDAYFRLHYEYPLEIAQLGTIDDMAVYSHEECAFK